MPHEKDASSAERFGDMTQIFERGDRRPSIWDAAFIDEALKRLFERHRYHPECDFILTTGPMAPITMFLCALCVECAGAAPRALFFDVVTGEYIAKFIGEYWREPESAGPVPARS
jgi:hypothetical protein